MHESVTFLRQDQRTDSEAGTSSLPADLLDQVRGRVRLLAIIISLAFAYDPITYFGLWAVAAIMGKPLNPHFYERLGFMLVQLGAIVLSVALWWAARRKVVSSHRLLTLSLGYQVVICFVIAFLTTWQYFIEKSIVPNLTWVIVILVLFPLVIPGPPRRMLAGAIVAGAMSPFSLLVLSRLGKIRVTGSDYMEATIPVVFAVGFAYMGARVVYRLGREVIAARQLGSYQLEQLLGRGGMGEVWRARHRMLARPAAIKLIRQQEEGNGSEQLVRRFEREAQVIAKLRSPHTVELFDFGVASNGSFFYAMELLDGLDADTLVKSFGPVPAERAVFLLTQICHSLSEAESCGLVHRDIKPANIYLCRYGEDYDFVKVLDFGLVKALDMPAEAEPNLTRENTVQGTPAFIAPEQAMGLPNLDSRVDIYAAGCVAYWLLTGQLVFSADTPMALIFQHAHNTPVAPSVRTELPIPPELDRIVLSCLAKNPADRPQTARDLARQLAALNLAGGWSQERAREWWNLHQPVSPG